MDGVDLIICEAVWKVSNLCSLLPSDDFLAGCIASRNRLRPSLPGAICRDFGEISGGFGRPKRRPKSIFGRFFFDVFFECVLASILGGFLEARNLKNSNFP